MTAVGKQLTREQSEVVASVLLEGITAHDSPYLRKAFGKTLFQLGRLDEAQRQFEIVQNVSTDDVYANLALTAVLIKKGDNPTRMLEAQNYLERAEKVLAEMEKTQDESKAGSSAKSGGTPFVSKDGKVEKPLDESVRREYRAFCLATQGVLDALMGNPQQAVKRLQSALKLDPENEVAQKALSLLESVRKNSPLAGK